MKKIISAALMVFISIASYSNFSDTLILVFNKSNPNQFVRSYSKLLNNINDSAGIKEYIFQVIPKMVVAQSPNSKKKVFQMLGDNGDHSVYGKLTFKNIDKKQLYDSTYEIRRINLLNTLRVSSSKDTLLKPKIQKLLDREETFLKKLRNLQINYFDLLKRNYTIIKFSSIRRISELHNLVSSNNKVIYILDIDEVNESNILLREVIFYN